MASGPITPWWIEGEKVKVGKDFIFFGSKITADGTAVMKLKDTCFLEEKLSKQSIVKEQRHHFASKVSYSHSYDFSSSRLCIWELDHKEGWELKNWCFQVVVLEKTLKSPLDIKQMKPVNPKGNQSWIFIGMTDLKLQYFDHLMRRVNSLEKTLMLGKIEGKRRRGWQSMRC